MPTPRDDSAEREQRLNAILHDYLQAVDAGRAPDKEEVLRLHPDLASELAAFFADQERMDRLAQDMRSAGQAEAPDAAPLVRCVGDLELPEEIARGGMGVGAERLAAKFEADHDDCNGIMAKALADRLAEALAELLHARARRDWGYGREERLSKDEMIAENYRGIRPAAGYPSWPDHTEKALLWRLLGVEAAAGIRLTES